MLIIAHCVCCIIGLVTLWGCIMMVVALWGLSPTKQMQREPSVNLYRIMFNCSVADPERFDADPDPTFHADADPDRGRKQICLLNLVMCIFLSTNAGEVVWGEG